jgi:hypothetical protein
MSIGLGFGADVTATTATVGTTDAVAAETTEFETSGTEATSSDALGF